jgi:Tol biopolymer transport system component
VLPDVPSAAVVAPTPSGRTYLLYTRDDTLVSHEFDERTGQMRGSAHVVVEGIGKVASPALLPTVGVSPRGVLAFQQGAELSDKKLTWLDRAGKPVADVALEASPGGFSLSPDGSRLAFDADVRGEIDLWVTDLTRNNTLRLTRTPESERSAVWSPDGNRIAYSKAAKIYVKSADGLSDETALADVNGAPRAWSPDGKYLLYTQTDASGAGRLFFWPLMGGAPIPLGRRDGASRDGRFSPDSGFVAYVSNETGRDEIYIEAVPPARGRIKVSQGGGTTPRWGSTSRELFFYGADRALMVADLQLGSTLSAGELRRLIPGDALLDRREMEVSPDGKRFLVRRLAGEGPDTPITVVLNWWVELARKSQ